MQRRCRAAAAGPRSKSLPAWLPKNVRINYAASGSPEAAAFSWQNCTRCLNSCVV
jgi:hypothetical protein